PEHEGEAHDEPACPQRDEQEQRHGPEEAEVRLATFAAAPVPGWPAPEQPQGPDHQDSEPHTARDPARQHDRLEGVQEHLPNQQRADERREQHRSASLSRAIPPPCFTARALRVDNMPAQLPLCTCLAASISAVVPCASRRDRLPATSLMAAEAGGE